MSFTYAFLDSWSQTRPNINDQVQQEHWIEESNKLWEYSDREDTFEFMTIDDVLEENAQCKEDNAVCQEENKRLLDIIDEAITDLRKSGLKVLLYCI